MTGLGILFSVSQILLGLPLSIVRRSSFPFFVKYMKKQIKIILLHEKTNQNNCFANYFGALLMAKVEHNSNNGIYTYIKTLESYFKITQWALKYDLNNKM